MICINREYIELNGKTQLGNEVDIIIQKVKPRIVGNTGICKLDYDWIKKCYSETIDGRINVIDTGFKDKYIAPQKAIQSTINLNNPFDTAPF